MAAPRRLHLPTLVIALATLAVFAVHLRAWSFICDDAYISFRYAANFAEGGELAYNLAPLERVEGYTNPLWVFVLALGHGLGLDLASWASALCATASGLALLCCVGLTRELVPPAAREGGGPLGLLFVAAAWLVATPEFVVWGSGGLEGSFALVLGLGAALACARGRLAWTAGLAMAALLTRLDALIWLAPSLGGLWFISGRARSEETSARHRLRALAIFALPLLVHLIFRRVYYEAWLPNTWAVKGSGAALRMDWGVAYLRAWALGSGVLVLLPLLPLGWRRSWPLLLGASANLAWGWWVGGDFMAYGRFLLPATTLMAIAGAVALAHVVVRASEGRWGRSSPHAARIGLAVALLLAGLQAWRIPARLAADRERAWLDERWESVDGMQQFAAVRRAAGARMASELPADTRASVGAAGAFPFASGFFAFDAYGLVDPGVAQLEAAKIRGRVRPGHQFHAPLSYLRAREPDLMCHIGWASSEGPPPPREAARRAGRGWTWYCAQTGPIEDPRRPEGLPNHWYCCPAAPEFGAGLEAPEEGRP